VEEINKQTAGISPFLLGCLQRKEVAKAVIFIGLSYSTTRITTVDRVKIVSLGANGFCYLLPNATNLTK